MSWLTDSFDNIENKIKTKEQRMNEKYKVYRIKTKEELAEIELKRIEKKLEKLMNTRMYKSFIAINNFNKRFGLKEITFKEYMDNHPRQKKRTANEWMKVYHG